MKAVKVWHGAMALLLAAAFAYGDDGWQFQVGGVYQWGMKMSTRGPSITTPHNYSGPLLPPDASNPDGAGGHTYVDGYVRREWVMDDPDAVGADRTMTWNWRYLNDSQYNADNHTLAFHSQTDQSSTSSGNDRFNAAGVELSARRQLLHCCGLDLGIDLDLAWFPDAHAASQPRAPYHTDYYDDTWGVVPGLSHPYQGPDFDNADGVDAPPITYDPILSTDTLISTKAKLYRVRMGCGPTLQVALTDKLGLYVTPQFTLSLAHADVTRKEIVSSAVDAGPATVSSNETSNDRTALLAGFLLAAGLDYKFAPNWVIGAYIGHEWIPDTMSVDVGSDRTRLDLGGGEASCYIGMTF